MTSFVLGRFTVDLDRGVASRGDDTVALGPIERRLLEVLASEHGAAVSRQRLLADVWPPGSASLRTVDTVIRRLRVKLEHQPERPVHILTALGQGYRLAIEPDAPGEAARTSGPDTIVGRDDELAEIVRLYESGTRLVTIIGPGGVGKTRLAAELVARSPGARFVDLTDCHGEQDVVNALRRALPDAAESAADGEGALKELARHHSGSADRLIVFDNTEQLDPVIAPVLDVFLAAGARVLVTSRVRHRHLAQRCLLLEPLEPRFAAALLRERIAARLGRCDDTVAALLELARVLDGLPLAIELAAAHSVLLPPSELLERWRGWAERIPAASPARHPSMVASLEASWDLLSTAEQAVFTQLSMFSQGADLDAILAVVAVPEGEHRTLLEVLERLEAVSLIRVVRQPRCRVVMLDTIRRFAEQRLAQRADAKPAWQRFLAYFGGRSVQSACRLPNAGFPASLRAWVQAEWSNLGLVCDHPEASPEWRVAAGTLLAQASTRADGFLRLERVVALGATGEVGANARLLLSTLAANLGNIDLAEREAALVVEHGPPQLRSWALAQRSLVLLNGSTWGQTMQALEFARQAVDAARHASCRGGLVKSLHLLAATTGTLGRVDESLDAVREALAMLPADASPARAVSLLELDLYVRLLGNQRGSAAAVAAELGPKVASLYPCATRDQADRALAVYQWLTGDVQAAIERLDHILEDTSRPIAPALLTEVRATRGAIHKLDGRSAEASDDLHRVERYARALAHDNRHRGFASLCLAGLAASAGDFETARAAHERGAARYETALGPEVSLPKLVGIEIAVASAACSPGCTAALARELAAVRPLVYGWYEHRLFEQLSSRIAELDGADAEPALRIWVGAECAWVRPDRGAALDLSRRPVMRRLVRALLQAHGAGATLGVSDLFAAGWPGERARPESAAHRVYVAVARLRALGMGTIVQHQGEGYRIDPACEVVVQHPSP